MNCPALPNFFRSLYLRFSMLASLAPVALWIWAVVKRPAPIMLSRFSANAPLSGAVSLHHPGRWPGLCMCFLDPAWPSDPGGFLWMRRADASENKSVTLL